MRTRTLITGAAVLAFGVASAGKAHAQLNLRGSDTLDLVSTDVIAACPGAAGNIVYVGGGSGAGQSAMASGTQHVAPMSRQLNGSQCTANSRQLLVGLDGLSIVAQNVTHVDPATCTDDIGGVSSPLVLTGIPSQFIPCTTSSQCTTFGTTCDTVRQFCVPGGTLTGCTAAQGCSPDGTYTFDNGTASAADDWQDVVRQIYGGVNHTGAPTLINDPTEVNADGTAICQGATVVVDTATCGPTTACPAGQFCDAGQCKHQVGNGTARNCKRNPARIDCSNPVRGVLLASYSSIIRTPSCTSPSTPTACTTTADCPLGQTCNTTIGQCTPTDCVKLKHAFRRDDLSGTTDAFVSLVGLTTIASPTTMRSTVGGANAPEVADFAAVASPFCNAGTAALNKGMTDGLDLDPYRRACSAGPAPDRLALEEVCQAWANPTNSDVACYVTGVTPANYPQRERSSPQGRGVLPGGSVDTLAAFENDYRLTNTTRPRCLGVVIPMSIPQEIVGGTVWAQFRYPAGGNCTAGVRAFVNPLPARTMLCPDGTQKAAGGTCRLPQNTANGRFDCVVDSTLAAGTVSDPRIFNLGPVNSAGNMASLLDSYQNPSFPGVNGVRRFARRYYGMHMVRADNSLKTATSAGPCVSDSDTPQIGCLVKTSPCSIGYAGREAVDSTAPFNNTSLTLVGIPANTTNIINLATGGTPVYPMARKLWFNSFQDPNVGFTQPALSDPELALSNCMGLSGNTTIIDTAIANHNFVVVPPGVPRLTTNASGGGCPLP